MFYYVSGIVAEIEASLAVIDCGGVGYACSTTNYTLSQLKKGEKAKLYTYLNVKEDGVELFGFATTEELNLFKLLITVSGVGPKAAISLLSSFPPTKIAVAVCSEDKKTLSKASGIGPKTAARIILELKDKLKADTAAAETGTELPDEPILPGDRSQEALEALLVLGYNRATALDVLSKIDTKNNDLETVIRDALKLLMK